MTFQKLATGAAAAALFLVSGCGAGAPGDRDAAASRADTPAALAEAEVARPPAVAEEANAVEAEPLNDAGEIASEIASNTMIARVPVDGGLAWLQDGDVVRTASHDGRRVAYFHPGESRPFLVQQASQTYALDEGRAELAYDAAGRPAPVSAVAREEAERIADQSRRARDEAERVDPEG
ncbi:MAG TPA: hypothetical protein VMG08_09580 [Allosphingosinicella sp.]|nr:hypothetical protein [Allosphingosinicella sp.]